MLERRDNPTILRLLAHEYHIPAVNRTARAAGASGMFGVVHSQAARRRNGANGLRSSLSQKLLQGLNMARYAFANLAIRRWKSLVRRR